MALPTIHWKRLSGTLTGGQSAAVAHTLKTGKFPAGVTPDAVLADMSSGVYTEPPNVSIGEYQARTSTYVYLSNFDSRGSTHYYGVVARKFHSVDGANL